MKEGEFNICAAENLSSVKTLSKVVSLKSRFEGREGRADLCSREADPARPHAVFFLKVGCEKVLSSKEECRALEGTQI